METIAQRIAKAEALWRSGAHAEARGDYESAGTGSPLCRRSA